MHLISQVEVAGFWGNYPLKFKVDRNITFIIGQNGTGKTTLINLIAATLTADFQTLDRLPFHEISIRLKHFDKNDYYTITASKITKKGSRFDSINYTILNEKTNKNTKFSLDDIEEQYILRGLDAPNRAVSSRSIQDYYRRFGSNLQSALEEIVNVNWLSVSRLPTKERTREDRLFESTIDKKIEALTNDIVRYFATFSKQKDDEFRKFQEYIFLSLIEQNESASIFETSIFKKVSDFREILSGIFMELHLEDSNTREKIRYFFDQAEESALRIANRGENGGWLASDIVMNMSLSRIEAIAKRWETFQEQIATIFRQRDIFVEILNDLFQRKKVHISESNELVFISRNGKELTPYMLSSGEKQLLILLSEILLQRHLPAILIADEPEISLHVVWQSRLVESLRRLNPTAQILIATHSPDIVGRSPEKAIDMEELLP